MTGVVLGRAGAVVFSAVAMLSMLLGLAALALGHPERTGVYLAVTAASAAVVGVLMRRDVRRRRAEEARLPAPARPARRVPRRPIAFPVRETTVTFALWYIAALVIDRGVTGTTNVFTLVAIAPFAAFMLAALTIAGRHMAFRLTAEEAGDPARENADSPAIADRSEAGDVVRDPSRSREREWRGPAMATTNKPKE